MNSTSNRHDNAWDWKWFEPEMLKIIAQDEHHFEAKTLNKEYLKYCI